MFSNIIDLLIPPKCHVCGETLLHSERFVCTQCCAALPRTMYHVRKDNPVEMRFAGKFPFRRASSHFFYTRSSALSTLIHDFKYRNFPSLARKLGSVMGDELTLAGFLNDIDYIMPLPIHWTRRLSRGYNQTEHIALGVSDISGIPVSTDLRTRRAHRTQTNLTPEQRLLNTQSLFTLKKPERYTGKHILLIDDVCTTGATLTSAANAILSANPHTDISLLTLACTF